MLGIKRQQLIAPDNFACFIDNSEAVRITVERQRFNDATREYNTSRRQFPTLIIANMFDFEEKPYFQAIAGAEAPPTVEF